MVTKNMTKNAYPVRQVFLSLYVVMNIMAGFIMIYTGEFLGDSRGETFNNVSVVITATLLVVGSYYVLLSPVFRFIDRIKVKQISHRIPDKIIGARIG